MELKSVLLGIGTNLGDKISNINRAYQLIEDQINPIVNKSKLYKTPPWGFNSSEEFYNTVIEIKITESAFELLKKIKKIEMQMGRNQIFKIGYSSRLIDIDILDFNGEIINSPKLTTPHPHLEKRNFVLFPIKDINPNWTHPTLHKTINELIEKEELNQNIEVIESTTYNKL